MLSTIPMVKWNGISLVSRKAQKIAYQCPGWSVVTSSADAA
jgi:hypothetical protein